MLARRNIQRHTKWLQPQTAVPWIGAALSCICVLASSASAQHPIDLQRASAAGDHFKALVFAEQMPRRIATIESSLALARSAWALGLNSRALDEFDRVLRTAQLDSVEKARIHLTKAILEYQEGHYQVASLHAERVINELEGIDTEPTLNSKARFVWGEALTRQNAYGPAELQYLQALEGAAAAELPQIHLSLASVELKLGKFEKAKEHFEQIPVDHELTPRAIRGLAEVSVELKRPDAVQFWLTKARKEYPDSFLDSWVDYALMCAAIDRNQIAEVSELRTQVANRLPPSDPWVVLLNAAAEGFVWNKRGGK
jgi:tetratricopeptide (TPR) repeat protein